MFFFTVWGWAGAFLYHYVPLSSAVKDFITNLKFYLSVGTGFMLFDDPRCDFKKVGQQIYRLVYGISIVFMVLSLADRFFCIWYTQLRGGFPSIKLFYNSYTTVVALGLFLGAILMRYHEEYGTKIIPPLCFLAVLVYQTRRVKAMGAITCLLLVYLLVFHRNSLKKRMKLLAGGVILVGIVSAVIQIKYYISLGFTTARAVLTASAPFVAWDHFPFGAGWGSYASHFSADPYSQLYYNYHMQGIWGMSPGFHDYIADTFWPMLMGECGFIGFAAYVAALVLFIRWILTRLRPYSGSFASVAALLAYLFISSTSESAFANPLAVPMAFWMGYLLAECSHRPGKAERAL